MKYVVLVAALAACGKDGSDPMGDGPAGDTQPVTVDGATASWRLLHAEHSTGAKTIAINPTAPGSLLVVGVQTVASPQVAAITDNAGNVYQPIGAARSVLGTRALELWFAPNVPENATRVTVDTTTVDALVVWEVAGIDPTGSLDSGAKLDDQPSTGLLRSPALTTARANELVIAVALGEQPIGNLTSDQFATDATVGGAGWTHKSSAISQPGTYQAEWFQVPDGAFCTSAAAFFTAP